MCPAGGMSPASALAGGRRSLAHAAAMNGRERRRARAFIVRLFWSRSSAVSTPLLVDRPARRDPRVECARRDREDGGVAGVEEVVRAGEDREAIEQIFRHPY